MTGPPPPEEPTRPLAPGEPLPPVARERVVETTVGPDPGLIQYLEEQLSSLRRWLALIGMLALIATAIGLYALLTSEEEEDTRAGASRARVEAIDERLEKLEDEVRTAGEESDVRRLRSRLDDKADAAEVEELAETVAALEGQVDGDDDGETAAQLDDLAQSIETLDQRLTELEQRQNDLEQQQP